MRLCGNAVLFLMAAILAMSPTLPAQTPATEVTYRNLLDGLKDPTRWLTYSGEYNGQRHSPLTQITPENVTRLTSTWSFQTGLPGNFQATPIVLDGVIYISGNSNNAWA